VTCRYGIGQIYFRQEKFDMAINNFKHALQINPRSSVLCCYLGMAYHKQGLASEALDWLQQAIEADAQNPLARFERASVLISQDKLVEAIDKLENLQVRPRCGPQCAQLDHAVLE
jgi:anaphase-promoting complex subunit 3